MKTKENLQSKTSPALPVVGAKTKAKSLRPMRSMVAIRSLKPKTAVAAMVLKPEASA